MTCNYCLGVVSVLTMLFQKLIEDFDMGKANLTPIEVARIADDCHPNTVKNYAKKGFLNPVLDINGTYRFSMEDALKLKALLASRWPTRQGK